ncbi:pyridoxamine 5'-phosphate oxidase family protein [Thalassorhabdomicrobium marinisediminis]|uniref:Pyridoxamine 5'-phosphate oxidase n=1 Tax=Thalassorhabdomicrobium marinisediminis TaxID=2170577 RepID=A0A2T7FYR7_9RHOB|nr:pyridoxamine 5'-phosphate oxidase family protein [Thalassorhabdomicrobium marinisediminis]PVA07312.1 pyridoxamine 5'-phosphate oxidase [Thalassorhabdomicrobium marinisediminis]
MKTVTDITELEALYDAPLQVVLDKVVSRLTPLYTEWINAARFCVLSTAGAEGTDGSPRGDVGPVARVVDDTTLHLPDWRGNNRMDTLRNIVTDGRISVLFMVPGATNVIRINGTAVLSDDPELTQSFEQGGKHPRTVIVITVGEVYYQCAKAIMRSELWTAAPRRDLPTAGQFVKEQQADFDAEGYDAGYDARAKTRMW